MYLEVLPVVLSRIKDIDKELIALGFETEKSTLIVYRVFEGITSLKLKYLDKQYLVLNFEDEKYNVSLRNHRILEELGVKVVKYNCQRNKTIVFDADKYELCDKTMTTNKEKVKLLASWFKDFHSKEITTPIKRQLGNTQDFFTLHNIKKIIKQFNFQNNKSINLILNNYKTIVARLNSLPLVLSLNTISMCNFTCDTKNNEHVLFQCNELSLNYPYHDIKNVLDLLNKPNGKVFMDEYGSIDDDEIIIDDIISPLSDLYYSLNEKYFPIWASEALGMVKSKEYYQKILKLLNS